MPKAGTLPGTFHSIRFASSLYAADRLDQRIYYIYLREFTKKSEDIWANGGRRKERQDLIHLSFGRSGEKWF